MVALKALLLDQLFNFLDNLSTGVIFLRYTNCRKGKIGFEITVVVALGHGCVAQS